MSTSSPRAVLDPGAHRRALALVGAVGDDAHRRVLQGRQHLVGPVGRAVVDHDHLELHGQVDGADAAEDLGHGVALVEHRAR